MLATLLSSTLIGVDAIPIEVEVDVSQGLPGYAVVGLPAPSVKEGGVRIRAALQACGYKLPSCKITVNLAPADVRKPGSAFDLPIALAVMLADAEFEVHALRNLIVLGELGLDGSIRAVRGALAAALLAKQAGYRGVLVPKASVQEAAVVDGIEVYAAEHIGEAIDMMTGKLPLLQVGRQPPRQLGSSAVDMSELRGQGIARAAMEIAVAGGHNILLAGPPGIGKTMLARRVPTILPAMSHAEMLETTKVYSAAGLSDGELVHTRPFRAPHHTVSQAALLGGGSLPRPGEISLAHNGVLFLDELAEFSKQAIEGLRQPLEDRQIVVGRVAGTIRLPASFLLVGSANPCPCGWLDSGVRECVCSSLTIEKYRAKLSGPILDRMDLQVFVRPISLAQMRDPKPAESSAKIRERVAAARERQVARLAPWGLFCNAAMPSAVQRKTCELDRAGEKALAVIVEKQRIVSSRGIDRLVKVARTIADLADQAMITDECLFEASAYRGMDRPGEVPSLPNVVSGSATALRTA